jgi:AraC-like DNA-binding protein
MLVICFHLTNYYLHHQGYWEIYPHLVGIAAPLPLVYGPLLYLYVLYSIKGEQGLKSKDYWHFAPFFLAFLYMFRFYFFYSAEEKRLVDSGQINDFDTFYIIMIIAYVVTGVVYSIFSYRLLDRHQSLIDNNFSNADGIHLNWLRSIILGVGVFFMSVIFVLGAKNFAGITFPFDPDYIFYSIMVLGILVLGYFGIRHENIFVDNVVVTVEEKNKTQYEKSGLKTEIATAKYNELLELMAQEKPFLEPKLTLHTLAKSLDISPNHLSQIINQFEEHNFNDFVNTYRVEEFIKRASKDSHLSFLALALDAGFNSKSTFNAVFKKLKGMTPSQYMFAYVGQV